MIKTIEQLRKILDNIKIFDRRFDAYECRVRHGELDVEVEKGWLVSVVYEEADVVSGKVETQRSREWYIGEGATETDVVHTAFAAVMRSYDHVVKEHFTYKGVRVYSPHVDIEERLSVGRKH